MQNFYIIKRSVSRTVFLFLALLVIGSAKAQCDGVTVASSCGYTTVIRVNPLAIVPTTPCPSGYNYNVTFAYTIAIQGTNSCYDGSIGFQPQIFCNSGQSNAYYTINVAAPTVGAAYSTAIYNGTLTTTTNPYRSNNDCHTATPTSIGCSSSQFTEFGPGISTTTYPCSSSLPITLREFKAYPYNRHVMLEWTTDLEKNNDYFTIERSSNGGNWEIVTTMKGAGNSSQVRHYSYMDNSAPEGANYYRLKQTDFDGKAAYSSIVFASTRTGSDDLTIYPNPANDVLNIENMGEQLQDVVLLNSLSQVVFQKQAQNKLAISLEHLPQGIYLLKVSSGSYKIIRQ